MHRHVFALVAFALVAPGFATAAGPEVVAVVACDPYGDLKKQLRWVGGLVEQPTLDGFAESFIMMATQFKGLAGLDVGRPAGLVVTAAGDVPAVHAYVPVKDLGKLLDALVGLTGPVEEADGVRRVSPPGGMPLDIVEKNGWAIIGPRGSAPAIADPTTLFDPIVKAFTIGVEAFPRRMPEGMRRQILARIAEAQAAAAAARGAPAAPEGATLAEYLLGPESLLVGAAVDMDQERVFVETQSRMPPESPAAGMFTGAANGAVTVATPATADGKQPAVALHLAMPVPETMRQEAIDGLATITARQGSDAGTETAVAILKESLAAMIAAGGCDAAVSVDTSAVAGDAERPVPAVTAGMRVKDGAALEARIKKLVAAAGDVPGLDVAFDAGKAAGANLHTVTLDGMDLAGGDGADDPLAITLAVSPTYAWVLAGGDVPARLAAVAGASGKPDPTVKPMADLTLALGPLLRYAAAVARADDDVASDPAGLEAAAAFADEQPSSLVQLLARPIQQGMSLRLSADSGAIRTVALQMKPVAAPPGALPPGRKPRPLSPVLAP